MLLLILISFGATIIVAYSVYTATSHTAPGEITPLYALRQQFWNHSASTCKTIFAPLIGLLISAYILSDIRNGFSDLMVSSSKSLLSSYLSKLCAIGTVAFVARWIVLGVCLVWFWNVHYPIEFVPDGAVLPLKDILIGYVASETVFVPFLLYVFSTHKKGNGPLYMTLTLVGLLLIPLSVVFWTIVNTFLYGYHFSASDLLMIVMYLVEAVCFGTPLLMIILKLRNKILPIIALGFGTFLFTLTLFGSVLNLLMNADFYFDFEYAYAFSNLCSLLSGIDRLLGVILVFNLVSIR